MLVSDFETGIGELRTDRGETLYRPGVHPVLHRIGTVWIGVNLDARRMLVAQLGLEMHLDRSAGQWPLLRPFQPHI